MLEVTIFNPSAQDAEIKGSVFPEKMNKKIKVRETRSGNSHSDLEWGKKNTVDAKNLMIYAYVAAKCC